MLLALLPSFIVTGLLIVAERWRGAPRTDWLINLQSWAAQLVVAIVILPLVPLWQGAALLDARKLPFWGGFIIFLLVRDAGEYAYHRAQHRIPMLWAMHALHHSDPEMAALTTQRHFWGDQIFKQITIWSLALMVINPTPALLFAYGMVSLVNYLTHSNLPINLGRWSWLINTPAYHRRHHSTLPEHYDSNFAAIFPIFDVLCGSYHRPDGFPPTGQDRAPKTFTQMLIWPWLWNRPEALFAPARHKETV